MIFILRVLKNIKCLYFLIPHEFDNMYLAMDADGAIVIYESRPYYCDGLIWNTNNNYEVIGHIKDDQSNEYFPFKKSEIIKLDKYEYYQYIYKLKDYTR